MNRIDLVGRLASDVELKFTPSGLAMARVNLAVDRPMTKEKKEQDKKDNKPTADFPRLLMMGKLAENASRYVGKGSMVAVEGSIKTSSYENAEGQKIYSTEVLCERVTFLDQPRRTQADEPELGADSFTIEEVPF